MIAIIDYGMGNVRSVFNALDYLGADAVVTSDHLQIRKADRIILPGVGAFGQAMKNLLEADLVDLLTEQVIEKQKPFLGICLGLQLLAKGGLEHGRHAGLGWLDAQVIPLEPGPDLKLPHMGWNDVTPENNHPLFENIRPEHCVFYFVHSFRIACNDKNDILATCMYGRQFVAAVAKKNIAATQFHPEKSQDSGLEFLENFIEWQPESC